MTQGPKLAGIDPSLTSTAVACSWKSGPVTLRPPASHADGMRRLDWIERRVAAEVAGVELVAIEGYSMGQQRGESQAHALGELGGVLRLMFFRIGIPYVDVSPAKLKVFATGNGLSKKAAMYGEAIRRLGYAGSSHDEADALWLLEMARHAYGYPSVALPGSHTRSLVSGKGIIEWPKLEKSRV